MNYCLDTSGINRLHDDSDCKVFMTCLLATNRVLVTALNVIEAAATEDVNRRASLLTLLRDLAQGTRPLQVPNDLINAMIMAYAERRNKVDIAVGKPQEEIWQAIQWPEMVGEQERQECLRWKEALEKSFVEAHRLGRLEFQKLIQASGGKPSLSTARLVRHYCKEQTTVLEITNSIYEPLTGKKLNSDRLRPLLDAVPNWALYLASWGDSIYHRDIKEQGYGVNTNPGTIDLWFAVFLPCCDYFVTADKGQRKSLRVLNALNPHRPRTRVLDYSEFCKRLIL